MTDKSFTNLTLRDYLNALASDEPVPGGGSVSAYAAALAMGLTQMVARIALKRKKKAGLSAADEKKEDEKRKTVTGILETLEKTKKDAFQIVDLDPKVYGEVMTVWNDEAKREDALRNSYRLQADLALLVVMASEWNQNLAHLVSGSIKNDLLVSAGLLEGAFKGAYHTAMINVVCMKEGGERTKAEKALEELKTRFAKGGKLDG
ncbi:MAG: cyclodeaminase/cyclohydrolase family protein [Candidatus Omnitrophota bacterium]